ncbi:hypothetical protein MKEN_01126700 [Mycena kentingensis (nom. inval.)]|nr:hypothetical protein MKEN_01126700 [Mycena kentingensis (nom. inval.)]
MSDPEVWTFTILRAHGMQLMRPERSWRPIVVVEVGHSTPYETTLGSDGQNVNQRDAFRVRGVSMASEVSVKIYHRPQSKKKGKKRSLCASHSCSLGEMWKKHGREPKLRLHCQNPNKVASRGRPQKGVVLHLRLSPPPSVTTPPPSFDATLVDEHGYASEASSSSASSAPIFSPIETKPTLPRRRRGYCINSDDEPESCSETELEDDDETKPFLFCDDEDPLPPAPVWTVLNPISWIAAARAPPLSRVNSMATLVTGRELSPIERALSKITLYDELRAAYTHEDRIAVQEKLCSEWRWMLTIHSSLAGISGVIFGMGSDSIFTVDRIAEAAVTTSIVASVFGVLSVAWLYLRYGHADADTCFDRAEDFLSTETQSSFLFFALSARTPFVLLCASGGALATFMLTVAWASFPGAVLYTSFVVGLLMGLQLIAFVFFKVGKGFPRLWRVFRGPAPDVENNVTKEDSPRDDAVKAV